MKNPNIEDLENFASDKGLVLSDYQFQLAHNLINYRNRHFSGGLRSGRSTVVNLVQEYFDKDFPAYKNAGKEI